MSKYPSKIDLNKYEKKWMKYKSVFMHKICELYMNIPGILEQKRNFNVFAGSDYWDQILQNDNKKYCFAPFNYFENAKTSSKIQIFVHLENV